MTRVKIQEGQAELPTPESTHSYWHHDPSPALLGHRTTDKLPVEADVIVVGSGITGAFAARELVDGGRDVLMLEAREACWGATGRNGGHCHPLVFLSKPSIAQFELDNYFFLRDLVGTNRVPCDWRSVGAVCRLSTEAEARAAEESVRLLRRHHPALADKALYVDDPAELRRLRVPGAAAAVVHPHAASLWPYKLVAWVLEALLRTNEEARLRFNLQTDTPVTKLQRLENGSWMMHTPRGQVLAKQVLLATNGYTSRLLPKMTDLIRPTRGQVAAFPPPAAGGQTSLEHTYIWSTQDDADDYLVQRDDGLLIIGGERSGDAASRSQTSRDDAIDPDISTRLRNSVHNVLSLQSDDQEEQLPAATYEWTGIMGYSRDGHPWVGVVPEALGGGEGLFVSAGYTGHGMPAASRSGVAVARRMMGRGDVVGGLPKEFEVSEERARQAERMMLPRTLEDEIRMNTFWIQEHREEMF